MRRIFLSGMVALAAAASLFTACSGDDNSVGDGGTDGGKDATSGDTGTVDTGAADTGSTDAGDAAVTDAGDAGPSYLMLSYSSEGYSKTSFTAYRMGDFSTAGVFEYSSYGTQANGATSPWVLEGANDRVHQMDPVEPWKVVSTWNVATPKTSDGGFPFSNPSGVAEVGGKAYVTLFDRNLIAVLDLATVSDGGAPTKLIDVSKWQQAADGDGHVDMSDILYVPSQKRLYVLLGNIDLGKVDPHLETLLGGLTAGMLYSLVALGFVLIFKASGVFNFAQGAMVLFAALAMARFSEWIPKWTGIESLVFANLAAFAMAAVIMFAVAWLIERLVLRHLVNQEGATLLMATLGIAYFMEGLGQTIFGGSIYKIDIGMPKDPVFALDSVFPGGILINKEDLYAALIAAVLVALLSVFFQKTATGRALRAVADDHQAAQSIGIPLNRIWVIVWCVAGVVALVAGMIWGSKLGVQFSLATIALRALPVVILGGLTSVPGAIIGGLIIGVGEKLSEVYLGPYVGGGIEIWFAYVLALGFLLFRPQGLFGEKIIDRV